jgi:hypothetical protein
MKLNLVRLALPVILALGLHLLIPPGSHFAQTEEYLTDAEIDQLRTEEGKEPPERIRLLTGFLKTRFEQAKAAKTGVPYQEKGAKEKASTKKEPAVSETKSSPEVAPSKSFKARMGDYQRCLDEITTNLEDFSTLHLAEPKPYMKSLKNLRESLEEQQKWILEIKDKIQNGDKEVFGDVVDTLRDLLGDVNSNIDELNQQIEDAKDTRKSKASSTK